MTKLTGWKRIGVVASVIWILGASTYTFQTERAADNRFSVSLVRDCQNSNRTYTGAFIDREAYNKCWEQGWDYTVKALPQEREKAAIVAFVPVPFGWGLVYLVLFLVRWIKRGFERPF